MNTFKLYGLKAFALLSIFLQLINYDVCAKELQKPEDAVKDVLIVNLEECLNIALENNRQRRVSQSAIEIAEAQHKQALSAYWPQLKLEISATRMDEDMNFIFPEDTSTYTISGLAPVPVNAVVTVPEKEVKLMDRDTMLSSLSLTYPIYTGGKRTAISKQAKIGAEVAKESARRTDLQLIYDIKRMYYGAALAKKLRDLGCDTLDRLNVTLELTEHLYKTGSGTVKKTDYLRTRVMVSTIRSVVELLSSNEELSKAALINSMGLDWRTHIKLAETKIPYSPYSGDLAKLVSDAYEFSPDWSKFRLGLEAAEARIKEAQSSHFPMIALTGKLNHIGNSYDKGLMTNENRNSWMVGIGMEFPLFTGFRTKNEIREAKARLDKLKHQKILLQEGIALQVKDAFLQIGRAKGQVIATKDSLDAALENRKLNIRAYQDELVETRDVIEAQLLESYINGQHLKARHDHMISQAGLDFIIGNKLEKGIWEETVR